MRHAFLALAPVLLLGCAAPPEGGRKAAAALTAAPPGGAPSPPLAPPLARSAHPSRGRRARPTVPERAPEIGVTRARSGEPSRKTLAEETRLSLSAWTTVSAEVSEAAVKDMRASVDASFKEWHDGQPECWAEMRREPLHFLPPRGSR